MGLNASDFDAFFREVHGYAPFKWQVELAEEVCTSGKWPRAISLPTGVGKTSVLDIAIFHLALEFDKKHDRKAPIRIVFVVDRRLVVDDAFEHAFDVAKNICKANGPTTKQVAEALKNISEEPLKVVKIRGGMAQENDWTKTPAQPSIIISTIDQVGSRLLFRGYGISDSMRPIHAGLLGSDVLYIVDEAHNSVQFCNTLEKIRQMQKGVKLRPFEVVSMSATLETQDAFPQKKEYARIVYEDSLLQDRLRAHKYARLEEARDVDLTKKFLKFAFELAENDDVKSVGVVVNRVSSARDIFSHMREEMTKDTRWDGCEIHLLIGRSRPFERDTFVKNRIGQIRAGSEITANCAFFIATQCIEVGVDVSFDALVTEIAPIDSLRQRFGRLNRRGGQHTSKATIVASKSEISSKNHRLDPIYKDTLPRVWEHLKKVGAGGKEVDFGIAYFEDSENAGMLAPKPDPVTLLPAYVDFWMQTRPSPKPDPSPHLFLHGMESKSQDVQIVWRADLTEELLTESTVSGQKDNRKSNIRQTLVSPPSSLEAVSVPIWTVRKWLAGKKDSDLGDIEGMSNVEYNDRGKKMVMRWAGRKNDMTRVISSDEVVPGDTIVVPASYGGCDEYGWNDNDRSNVKDISMECNIVQRRLLTMRLNESIVRDKFSCGTDVWNAIRKATTEYKESDKDKLIRNLKGIEGMPVLWKQMLEIMDHRHEFIEIEKESNGDEEKVSGITYKKKISDDEVNICLEGHVQGMSGYAKREEAGTNPSTDEDLEPYLSKKPVELRKHCKGVRDHACMFCTNVGLSDEIRNDIGIAAFLHDAGKAEKRVQALLRKKDPDDLVDSQMVAKGTGGVKSWEEYESYRCKAHLPQGYRHECWSVNLAKNHPDKEKASDPELVLYLVGTHHGYGRPWFPVVDDKHAGGIFEFDGVKATADHGITRLDSGWIEMFKRLNQRYGPWQLAHMESILRLADHCQSEKESRGND